MKKIATLILAFILCFSTVIVCFAADGHGEIVYDGFADFEETVAVTAYEDGTIFLTGNGIADVYNLDLILGYEFFDSVKGVTIVLSEGISGIINLGHLSVKAFAVDENNPYLSTDSQGALMSKDKTVLIRVPASQAGSKIYTVADTVKTLSSNCFENCYFKEIIIPDSVETIESLAFYDCDTNYIELPDSIKVIPEGAFIGYYNEVLVLPESVEKIEAGAFESYFIYPAIKFLFVMNPDCVIEELNSAVKLIGYTGSTAESFADENGNAFEPLDGNHSHLFVCRTTKVADCTQSGLYTYNCPCGNAEPYTEIIAATGHSMDYYYPSSDGEVYCEVCGIKADCNCICHKAESANASEFETLIYKILTFFWKLFSINEYCECGNNYHY